MIRPDIATRLGLLEAITAVSAVADAAHAPSGLTPGARLRARVEARLAGDRFKVLVAETPMHMQLPPGMRPGAMIELMYVGGNPRPTFVLLNPPATGGNAMLSPAASMLGALAQTAIADAAIPYQAAPVLDKPPHDTAEFGARLQQAFSRSGLFYESHQAQWLSGHRTREQLLHEPQARIPVPILQYRTSAPAAPHAGLAEPAQASPTAPRPEPPAPNIHEPAGHVIHKDTLPLVQQQLAALDTGQMLWRGEIWPGQTMDWQIGGEARAPDAEETPIRWQSRLRLTLPRMGEITALLGLDQRGVRIVLGAAGASAADALRTGQPAFVNSMRAAGLHLAGMEVQHDGAA